MICTFIGHRNTPNYIEPILKNTILDLIKNQNVNKFYVGNNGNFDVMVLKILKEFEKTYNINYSIVLPYYPKNKTLYIDYSKTILPDGIEKTPPRFGIVRRNKWMIENSNFLICYVTQDITNAYSFIKFAENKSKVIINLARLQL